MARPRKMTPEMIEKARKMLAAGVMRKIVCEAVGCNYNQLRRECGEAWKQKRTNAEVVH
jgi:hypothetical protein